MFTGDANARPFKTLEDHHLTNFELGVQFEWFWLFQWFLSFWREFWSKTRVTFYNPHIKVTGMNKDRIIIKELAGEWRSTSGPLCDLEKVDLNVPSLTFELLPNPLCPLGFGSPPSSVLAVDFHVNRVLESRCSLLCPFLLLWLQWSIAAAEGRELNPVLLTMSSRM